MNSFTISPSLDIKTGEYFLNRSIQAFYHSDYSGGGRWKIAGTIENIICTLKNDITPYSANVLQNASLQLENILLDDLPKILEITNENTLTVCVVPRAKMENSYLGNQKYFRSVVSSAVNKIKGYFNGTSYIIRHTDTITTHRAKSGYGGSGDMPYPGITKRTCNISSAVAGKNILLIDDLYTKTVNIDEDAIQALLDKNAKSVMFYAVGKTI